jgi:hypothetical protein
MCETRDRKVARRKPGLLQTPKLAARNYGDDRVCLPENGRQKRNERFASDIEYVVSWLVKIE